MASGIILPVTVSTEYFTQLLCEIKVLPDYVAVEDFFPDFITY
jgi:hypothetical protein